MKEVDPKTNPILETAYNKFLVAKAREHKLNKDIHNWEESLKQRPRWIAAIQGVLSIGYPDWWGIAPAVMDAHSEIIDALRKTPGYYPLRNLKAYTDSFVTRGIEFGYGFECRIDGHEFSVDFHKPSITGRVTKAKVRGIEVREEEDPVLHFPVYDRNIPIIGPYIYGPYRDNIIGFWRPEIGKDLVRVTMPKELSHEALINFNRRRLRETYIASLAV